MTVIVKPIHSQTNRYNKVKDSPFSAFVGHRSKFLIAGKGLTSWLSCVMFYCVFVTLLCGVLGHVWYLIVLIPDLCSLL